MKTIGSTLRRFVLAAAISGTLLGSGVTPATAITPDEIYNMGRHSFLVARYPEAISRLNQFCDMWPDHELVPQARRLKLMAEVRTEDARIAAEQATRARSWLNESNRLSKVLEPSEKAEVMAAAAIVTRTPLDLASAAVALEPTHLLHLLQRGWEPEKLETPHTVLSWLQAWQKKWAGVHHPAPLDDLLNLMQIRQLLRYQASPLPLLANANILKAWKCWPIADAIGRALDRAYASADLDIKRQACLLGLGWLAMKYPSDGSVGSGHYDKRDRGRDKIWRRYLDERGVHNQEAWFPQ